MFLNLFHLQFSNDRENKDERGAQSDELPGHLTYHYRYHLNLTVLNVITVLIDLTFPRS